MEAGNCFLGGALDAVKPHVGRNTTIYLPAGNGAFVATVVGGKSAAGLGVVFARCETWIESAKLGDDQAPLAKAEIADKSVAALLLED